MRILIEKASNSDFQEIRENQNAQDILNLMQEFNQNIIIEKGGILFIENEVDERGFYKRDTNFDYTITIYDDYVE